MGYSVDLFQHAPPSRRWTGTVCIHPVGGGPGEEVHRRTGYQSENSAAAGCDSAIERHQQLLAKRGGTLADTFSGDR
jgi:hypothetical protein